MADFFNAGGEQNFIDKFASTLGIHPSRIKIAGLRVGSVIVDYLIGPDPSDDPGEWTEYHGYTSKHTSDIRDVDENLQSLKNQGSALFETFTNVFGVPVLEMDDTTFLVSDDPVIEDTIGGGSFPAWAIVLIISGVLCCCLFAVACVFCGCSCISTLVFRPRKQKPDLEKVKQILAKSDLETPSIAYTQSAMKSDVNLKSAPSQVQEEFMKIEDDKSSNLF